jgi:death-on-curing protein
LGLSASAHARPQNAAAYSDPDVAELAALCALGVIKNHPFLDGNKRVGAVLLELFLDLNGYELVVGDAEMVAVILAVAAAEMSDGDFILWTRTNAVKRS